MGARRIAVEVGIGLLAVGMAWMGWGSAPAAKGSGSPTPTPGYRAYLPLVLRGCCSVPSGQVIVDEVAEWNEGYGWTWVGLVGNGLDRSITNVWLTVDLKNASGQTVETITASVPAWRIRPQERVCWKAVAFPSASWVTYTVGVTYTVSAQTWPDVEVVSASLGPGPSVSGSIRNAGGIPAHDPQATAWLRNDGRLADCISEILSPNPLPPAGTAGFTLYASRYLTGTVTLGGTHASGRPAP